MFKCLFLIILSLFSSNLLADGWGWYATYIDQNRLDNLLSDNTPLSDKSKLLDQFNEYLEKTGYGDPDIYTPILRHIFLTGSMAHPLPEKAFDRWSAFELLIYSRIDKNLTPDEYQSETIPPFVFYHIYEKYKHLEGSVILKSFRYGRKFGNSTPLKQCLATKKKSDFTPWRPMCTEAHILILPEEVAIFLRFLEKAKEDKEHFGNLGIDALFLEEFYEYVNMAKNNGYSLFFKGNN